MFANAAPDTQVPLNPNGQRSKIHRKGPRRALGYTSVTALPGRTHPLRNNGNAHIDFFEGADRPKRLWFTSGNARKILTEITWLFIRIDDGGLSPRKNVGDMLFFEDANTLVRARIDTFSAARTTLKKLGFFEGTRGPQPIGSYFLRFFLLAVFRVPMLDVLVHRDTQGNDALFEKIPSPVGRLRIFGGPWRRLCHAPALLSCGQRVTG